MADNIIAALPPGQRRDRFGQPVAFPPREHDELTYFLDCSAVRYTPPRDTLDPRAAHCTHHHVACECREAMLAEDRQEHRAAMADAAAIIAHLLDAPCRPDQRRSCEFCRGALTTWLNRHEAVYPRRCDEAAL